MIHYYGALPLDSGFMRAELAVLVLWGHRGMHRSSELAHWTYSSLISLATFVGHLCPITFVLVCE